MIKGQSNTDKRTISTKSYVFEFGKHKGKTVNWVLENDPGYILWLDYEGIKTFSDSILDVAQDNNYFDDYGSEDFRMDLLAEKNGRDDQ